MLATQGGEAQRGFGGELVQIDAIDAGTPLIFEDPQVRRLEVRFREFKACQGP